MDKMDGWMNKWINGCWTKKANTKNLLWNLIIFFLLNTLIHSIYDQISFFTFTKLINLHVLLNYENKEVFKFSFWNLVETPLFVYYCGLDCFFPVKLGNRKIVIVKFHSQFGLEINHIFKYRYNLIIDYFIWDVVIILLHRNGYDSNLNIYKRT